MGLFSRAAILACAAVFIAQALPAAAQGYPSKAVRFVVPFAPGGQSDVVARLVGQELSRRWGQPVVVDNKPGAATTIGNAMVAQAPADGHTLLLSPAPFVITQYACAKLPYDGRADFSPVALMVTNPMVLVVNPARVAARNVADFIAEAKRKGGEFAYATPGNGSLPHLGVELFKVQAGFDALHVPYKGGGPAVVDLVAGQVAFMFASPLEVMQHVKSGKLAVLGVTSAQRLPYWPDVATFKESGAGDYEAYAWFGVVVRSGTPKDVVERLNADIVAVLRSPEVSQRLTALGTDVTAGSTQDFARFLEAEHQRWSAAVKAAKLTMN